MRLLSIASGSSGNCIYVGDDTTHILIDAGISGKRIEAGLNSIGVSGKDLDAVFVTHEHIDHISGIGVLSRKYDVPIYATSGTIAGISTTRSVGDIDGQLYQVIHKNENITVGGLLIKAVPISHDAAEPVGYNVFSGKKKVTLATDIGHVTDTIRESLADSDLLLLEANHDVDMLKRGGYPWALKQRILGENGHLSNHTAGELLTEVMTGKMKYVFLGHLSDENNNPHLAYETVEGILRKNRIAVGTQVKMDMASRFQNGVKVEL